MSYAEKGVLVLIDNPDNQGDLPYRLECVQSMKNFDLRSKEEITQLRDLCTEALSEIENE